LTNLQIDRPTLSPTDYPNLEFISA